MTKRWRPNNRITFSKWYDCDRCGLPWPERSLRLQRGARVCPECYDKPSHEDHKARHQDSGERVPAPWVPDE